MTVDEDLKFRIEVCKHCNKKGAILLAVGWDEKACWECVRDQKVVNPTGNGWSN